jgi:hypothetical protein
LASLSFYHILPPPSSELFLVFFRGFSDVKVTRMCYH